MTDKTSKKNREIMINRAKEYKNNKEELREKTRNSYGEISEKEKDIKREYGWKKYQTFSKENKQWLKQNPKNYHKAKKWA